MPNIKSQKDRVVQAAAEQAPVSYTHLKEYIFTHTHSILSENAP